ncbi:MAG: hypothetical protein OZ928_07695 [Polyangiaceae bacterium]|nr:hypothetical protein [Polyangiaceae bacterium]
MRNTWVTDVRHFLDETGGFPDLPGPARRLADHFGAIVVAMSDLPRETIARTQVRCRRRPRRRLCTGRIVAVIDADTRIRWECPVCDDHGVISGWEGTPWDMRRAGDTQH